MKRAGKNINSCSLAGVALLVAIEGLNVYGYKWHHINHKHTQPLKRCTEPASVACVRVPKWEGSVFILILQKLPWMFVSAVKKVHTEKNRSWSFHRRYIVHAPSYSDVSYLPSSVVTWQEKAINPQDFNGKNGNFSSLLDSAWLPFATVEPKPVDWPVAWPPHLCSLRLAKSLYRYVRRGGDKNHSLLKRSHQLLGPKSLVPALLSFKEKEGKANLNSLSERAE